MSSPSLPQESFSSSNGRGSRLLGRGSRLLFLISSILSPASALAQPSSNQLPKFTDQLATSPLVLKVTESEQAILDMLPANQHLARKTIIDSINSFKDGANPKEQTAAYLWAQSVVASPNAPVAAKEQANIILATLTGSAKLQKSLLS